MASTNNAVSDVLMPRTQLGDCAPELGSLRAPPTSAPAVQDEFPRPPQAGVAPYDGCQFVCVTPTRLLLPPIPPLSMPLSPAASWVSGGLGALSPMLVLSPILPPLFGWLSPTAPISAPLPDSARIPPSANATGAAAPSDATPAAKAATPANDASSQSNLGPVVQLSMPPKCIERRNAVTDECASCGMHAVPEPECPAQAPVSQHNESTEPLSSVTPEPSTGASSDAEGGVAASSPPSRQADSGPFAALCGVARSIKPGEKLSGRVRKKPKVSAQKAKRVTESSSGVAPAHRSTAAKQSVAARAPYAYIWEEQQDAAASLLESIGFEVLGGPGGFACSLCSEPFVSRTFAVRHALRTHLGGKRFECKLCSQQFSRSDSLVRHMQRKHEV